MSSSSSSSSEPSRDNREATRRLGPLRSQRFVTDRHFSNFKTQTKVRTALAMLQDKQISEEGFLGAQFVLLLNGHL